MAARAKTKREPWHGTTSGYVDRKCRCDDCKAAWAEYHADYRARRFKNGKVKCRVKDCKEKADPKAGNGLCRLHHNRKIELKKKRDERNKRKKGRRRARTKSQA